MFLLLCPVCMSAADKLNAYPPAEEGRKREVFHLPKQTDEAARKVEIIVGKTVNLDAENQYAFGGRIEYSTIQGWGFPRYDVKEFGEMRGTRMLPDPKAPKIDRFITLAGEPYLIRYNSRLPVVVYAPDDVEVKLRLWRAEEHFFATPGE